jgi:hypothetical protein
VRFADAVALYEIATHATATRQTVSSATVRRFAAEVRRLSRAIDGFDDDETLSAFMRRCRRALRDLSTTPLPPAHEVFDLAGSVSYLSRLAERLRSSYPEQIVGRGDLCIAALRDLSADVSNPIGGLAAELLATGDLLRSGLVVKTMRLHEVRYWLWRTSPGVRLVTERELTALTGLETLVVIGPSYWYPPHLLSAPRAELIYFVHFDWLRDRERNTRLFSGSPVAPGAQIPTGPPHSASGLREDESMDADTLVPTVDWDALARASGIHRADSRQDPEIVDANLFLLAGGFSVYLEAVEGPTIHVVDLEAGAKPRLHSERTRQISEGDYIVLRSAGGTGDYIPEIADLFLGQRAPKLRALQSEWKALLRRRVRERGFSRVERDLQSLGVASPNLQYRLWQHSIRTREPNDFRLLMEYIGLGDRAGEIWTAMGDLSDAHLRAGQQVRHLLEEAVVDANTEELIQTGRADVRLGDIDAGTLSVLRVEGRSPQAASVAEDDLRVMRRVETDLWLG